MAQRISDSQIELMRTAFRQGKSIPHCAMVANTSVSTAKKYLADLIQSTVDEKLALSLSQFRLYVQAEFEQIGNDRAELKQLFTQLKDEHKTDYARLTAIRECYEQALAQVAKPIASASASIVEPSKIASIRDAIKSFASRYGCRIPVPRNKAELANWNEDRLLGHICYHIARWRFKHTHKQSVQIADLDTKAKQDWLDEVLEQER